MAVVGLICEGATDRAVLTPLLVGLLGPGTVVNAIQPPPDPGAHAGWGLVLAALHERRVSEALDFVDYVVIHLDTDVCEEPGFGVSRRVDARPRTHAELAEAVREHLVGLLRTDDPEADLACVAFAVAVDSVECWLLLHVDPGATKDSGCERALDRARHRRNERPLAKDPRAYADAARDLRAARALTAVGGRSASLDRFLAAVRALPARPAAGAPPE